MNYKLIIIILLIIILIFLYKKYKKEKEKEHFNLTEVLQNMATVYEESNGTLSFQNLKAIGDTALKRLIVNSTFVIRDGLTNTGGTITNTSTGGIVNMAGNIVNKGRLINSDNIKVDKSIEVLGDISGNLSSLKGIIVMWSGSIANIPEGWLLCDGTNGTPDLRSRFVVGASSSSAILAPGLTPKVVRAESGTETVTLTEQQIPTHNHGGVPAAADNCFKGGSCSGSRTHVSGLKTTDNYGGGQPHNNMPPFYALAFIMKK
jgi:microcystin-dependent protein